MSDYLAKARFLMRKHGITFSEACRRMGKASGRARRGKRAGEERLKRVEEYQRQLEKRGLK